MTTAEPGSEMAVPAGDARPDAPALRVVRTQNAFLALGLCVDHLMNKPAYKSLGFASWSKILAGQINRGHYRLVMNPAERVVGMLGWAYVDEAVADRWAIDPAVAFSGKTGDCVVFNIWSAETPEANAAVLDASRRAMRGRRYLYFRRFYPDGRSRPVKIECGRFNENHIARRAGATTGASKAEGG